MGTGVGVGVAVGTGVGVGVGVGVGIGVGVGVGVGFSVSCMYCEDTYPVFPLYVTLYQLAFEMSSTGTVVPCQLIKRNQTISS